MFQKFVKIRKWPHQFLEISVNNPRMFSARLEILLISQIRPSIWFLDPPLISILYMTIFLFQQISIFRVRLGPLSFPGRALRLG